MGDALVTFQGEIIGADHCAVENVTLAPRVVNGGTVLLTVDNVAMRLSGVTFQGTIARQATGLVARGAATAGTVIENCTFLSLARGIMIEGAIPFIRRTHFTDMAQVGIQLLDTAAKTGGNTLSRAEDASRGWNSFDLTGGALAVENNRSEELVMENTDWGVDTEAEVAALIGGTGTVDFIPFLEKGAAAAVASLLCTVWDADTQARLLDAAVRLTPGNLREVTENAKGVYAFPAVAPGAYTMEVNAPGYVMATRAVILPDGGLATFVMPLALGEEPSPGACSGSLGPKRDEPDDLWVTLLLFAALLVAARRRGVPPDPCASTHPTARGTTSPPSERPPRAG